MFLAGHLKEGDAFITEKMEQSVILAKEEEISDDPMVNVKTFFIFIKKACGLSFQLIKMKNKVVNLLQNGRNYL